jgi:hypothetical protein
MAEIAGEQQQQNIHRSVFACIARHDDDDDDDDDDSRYTHRDERHKLWINNLIRTAIDRRSVQYVVDFLDKNSSGCSGEDDDGDTHGVVVITELELLYWRLLYPSDGGLDVLRAFFARSDTTLTKVTLDVCNFGTAEDASQLLAAFHTNRTVIDLTIYAIQNLEGSSLGTSLSVLLQNMPQLQRLGCYHNRLFLEGLRAMQPALRANRTLKQLHLFEGHLDDECIRLLGDALVGNTTIELVDVAANVPLTSNCLGDITRLLESTRLKTMLLFWNSRVFKDEAATQKFVSALQHKNSTLQDLPYISYHNLPGDDEDSQNVILARINFCLTRNRQLNLVNLLLAPPPPSQHHHHQQQQHWNAAATRLMLTVSHKTITKFKLFAARPQILEKRVQRPAPATVVAGAAVSPAGTSTSNSSILQASSSSSSSSSSATTTSMQHEDSSSA